MDLAISVLAQVTSALEGLGILAINRNQLDLSYMTSWANQLGLSDLLLKAIREAT